ncbi:MAG: MraY family glycosyltransferase [Candidatus Dependentiae bacterium]|jgi:UDP-GlcNAc:undecaprenyl-phosphate GlcNAc-1-phosphate transferase
MPIILTLFFGFAAALVVGLYVIPRLILTAHRFGITDKPNGMLKQHEVATPYLGGLGVYLSFISALALTSPQQNNLLWLILGCTILLFLGLLDDLIDLPPAHKFVGHLVVALGFLHGGICLHTTFFSSWLATVVSLVWILTVINAFNLIDVMDGLSSTVALASAVSFAAVAWYTGQSEIVLLLAIFLGAVSAFWWYNKPAARMYLGDSGSLFLGGFFASVSLLIKWGHMHQYGFLVPPVLLALPLGEVLMLVCIRRYKGIKFYKGSRDHFAHYLQARGWSASRILSVVVAVSIAACLLSLLFLANIIPLVEWVALGVISAVAWLLFVYVL